MVTRQQKASARGDVVHPAILAHAQAERGRLLHDLDLDLLADALGEELEELLRDQLLELEQRAVLLVEVKVCAQTSDVVPGVAIDRAQLILLTRRARALDNIGSRFSPSVFL